MEKVKEDIGKFLEKLQDSYGGLLNTEIRDWEQVKQIVSFFINEHKQSTIIDFIDLSNWDCVESFSFDDESRSLELVWHDFLNSNDEFEISVFGAHLIKAEYLIDSIYITLNKGLPVLLLKGFYQDKKDINLKYNKGCSKFSLLNGHPFSVEILKEVKRKFHRITVPKIHCFTVSIVPNYLGAISVDESKSVLYRENLKLISEKILSIMEVVGATDETDQESLHINGNLARKHFESALKVLNLQQRTKFDKDYQKLMLGDLTNVIKDVSFANNVDFTLQNTVDTLNKCSHDAGVYISKSDVYKSLLFIVAAINLN
ncbi:hypothetical protein [Vibrio harveyi]|uniref:hypothetical protein n=1 Tax=Vibrio harveyi TaxID=669 RepID=UPI002480CAC2|nr:hypothetical protein [Vibrio harveyi]